MNVIHERYNHVIRVGQSAEDQRVAAACEIMGLDPMYLANEGKCLVLVDAKYAEKALQLIQSTTVGREAAVIGKLKNGEAGQVVLRTAIGGSRIITPLHGEPMTFFPFD